MDSPPGQHLISNPCGGEIFLGGQNSKAFAHGSLPAEPERGKILAWKNNLFALT